MKITPKPVVDRIFDGMYIKIFLQEQDMSV